jgi:outer membrane protein
MKRAKRAVLAGLLAASVSTVAMATDLMDVYNDALKSDPTYLGAKTTYLSALQDIKVGYAVLLPQVSATGGTYGSGFLSHTKNSGSVPTEGTVDQQGYGFALNISQAIFNYSAFMALSQAKLSVKQAASVFFAAEQDLMVRVADAYFAILEDQDVVRYAASNVLANKQTLDQATQQYKVGLKTQTDVYAAKAAYSSAVAEQIAAQTTLQNDEENLQAITGGHTYTNLSKLSDRFPLAKPSPAQMSPWVKVAADHNWALRAAHYAAQASKKGIDVQFGAHLPTLDLNASYSDNYSRGYSDTDELKGNSHINTAVVGLTLNVPIFSGGYVNTLTKQAEFDYQTAVNNMELQYRTVINNTSQAYLGVISGISQINADQSSVRSNESALKGLQAGYRVGTQTLVDVLNQQKLLLQAQQSYTTDRYKYVSDLISLKSSAGILSASDLVAINDWLGHAKGKSAKDRLALQRLGEKYQVNKAQATAVKK